MPFLGFHVIFLQRRTWTRGRSILARTELLLLLCRSRGQQDAEAEQLSQGHDGQSFGWVEKGARASGILEGGWRGGHGRWMSLCLVACVIVACRASSVSLFAYVLCDMRINCVVSCVLRVRCVELSCWEAKKERGNERVRAQKKRGSESDARTTRE